MGNRIVRVRVSLAPVELNITLPEDIKNLAEETNYVQEVAEEMFVDKLRDGELEPLLRKPGCMTVARIGYLPLQAD